MIHLHNHSDYSFLDGYSSVEQIAQRAKELGAPAIAITDHGNLSGVIDFYQECKKVGIKPIIGCELYVAEDRNFKEKVKEDGTPNEAYHITLLAMNECGYKNLIRIVTDAHLVGFYSRPKTDITVLRQYHEGVIALSGCIQGQIPQAILADDMQRAEDLAKEYAEIFEGRYFLELQANTMVEQRVINDALIRIGQELDIPTVVTCDAHYPRREDAEVHDALLAVGTRKPLDDPERLRFPSNDFFLMCEEDVRLTVNHDEAIENTQRIADMIDLEIEFDKLLVPDFPVPTGYTTDVYLAKLCMDGLYELIRKRNIDAVVYLERMQRELRIIRDKQLSTYVLIVWDFVNWARQNGIMVGAGRGSAVGSLINYLTGITCIDPIEYNLLFERFINAERTLLPDIDVDFCYEQRHLVTEYLASRYGEDKVASVVIFGTLLPRSAISDIGTVMGLPFSTCKDITRNVPKEGKITLEQALERSEKLREYAKRYPVLFDLVRKLEGRRRHQSTHASGFVISPIPLNEITALKYTDGSTGSITTQLEMDTLGKIGMVKFDILGLKTLTVIQETAKAVDIEDINNITVDDPAVYALLRSGHTLGIFQLESISAARDVKRLQPYGFSHIIDVSALIRPGPAESGATNLYMARKQGAQPITYLHPDLEPILSDTYGVLVFQEQVMRIAGKFAGYTPSEQDLFRAAIGKKNAVALRQEVEAFGKRARDNGYSAELVNKLCDDIQKHAQYSFNKSHAAAYGYITYQTALLKHHYPVQFMAALMSNHTSHPDKVRAYLQECKRLEIPILPPDINHSKAEFTVEGDAIRYGLANIKGIGAAATREIVAKQPFTSIEDFYNRVDRRVISKKVFNALAESGTFDGFDTNRYRVIQQYYELRKQHFKDKDVPPTGRLTKEKRLDLEYKYLGIYVTGHPLSAQDPGQWRDADDGDKTKVAGIVDSVLHFKTKHKEEPMCRASLDTPHGTVSAIVFPSTYEQYKSKFVKGNRLIVSGKKDDVNILVNTIKQLPGGVQDDQSECTVSAGTEVSSG